MGVPDGCPVKEFSPKEDCSPEECSLDCLNEYSSVYLWMATDRLGSIEVIEVDRE